MSAEILYAVLTCLGCFLAGYIVGRWSIPDMKLDIHLHRQIEEDIDDGPDDYHDYADDDYAD